MLFASLREKLELSNIDSKSVYTTNLTSNTEYSLLANNSYKMYIEAQNEAKSTILTGSNTLIDYPIVGQHINGVQRGVCWAAAVASMIRFEKPDIFFNLTAQNVADHMGIGYDDGATVYESRRALDDYLGSPYDPTVRILPLTTEQIKMAIDNVDPAYMSCSASTGFLQSVGHAAVMVGYNFTDTSTSIIIMDPGYEIFKPCNLGTNGKWTFAFGNLTFTWKQTVRLLYD